MVLVHGGWHGGWVWHPVAERLRAAGHEVHAPTLTGVGERAHLHGPHVGLATHVEDVVALLVMEDLHDVLLVGHSSSGAVITGVAQRAADRLAGLVYLDAFVPEPGRSLHDLMAPARREFFLSRVDGDDRIVLDPDEAMDGWAIRDPALRAWVGPRLTPQPRRVPDDPFPDLPVPPLPRWYVHCTDKPGPDAFAGIAAAAREDGTWRGVEVLDTGHDAMVTDPDGTVRVLLSVLG
ncbi:alpha/beta fold hydrolase [Actinomycetospora flava]|uniref:Alpha/beta hydrolase n=1 Tax=Actinomycetospora flava TaxID=3129232 RepID=A0ABU8LZW5_9PSEU